ncbi:MAG: hypothetical protein JWR30_2939, partial [Conexibacter sp.]|nr:hypothetical protein [Conexibacter sp.]
MLRLPVDLRFLELVRFLELLRFFVELFFLALGFVELVGFGAAGLPAPPRPVGAGGTLIVMFRGAGAAAPVPAEPGA